MSLEKIHANNRSAQNLTGALKALAKDVNPIIDAVIELQNNQDVKPYKVYVALLTQTGTNPPTATVLENTFNPMPSLAYNSPGEYLLKKTGAFSDPDKVFIINGFGTSANSQVIAGYNNINSIYISTGSQGLFTPSNDVLYKYPIEIRVYN